MVSGEWRVVRELAEQEAAAVDMAETLGSYFLPAWPRLPQLLTLSCSVSAPAWLAELLQVPGPGLCLVSRVTHRQQHRHPDHRYSR